MLPLTLAFFLFCSAAVIGLAMGILHARGTVSGKGVGILHGVFVVAAFAALVVGLLETDAGGAWWLLVGFLVAASGGAYLFARQLRGEPWPGLVIVAHGGLALATLVVLGLWVFGAVGGPEVPVLPESPDVEGTASD